MIRKVMVGAALVAALAAGFASKDASAQAAYYVTTYVPEAAGTNPTAIAIDPVTRQLFVTNHDDNTVSVFALTQQTVARAGTIPVGRQPNHVVVNDETGAVYVSNEGDGTMSVIDSRTRQVRSTSVVQVGGAMAIDPNTNHMFMLRESPSDELNVIVGDTFLQADAIRSYMPVTLAMNPVTNRLFVGTEATSDVVAMNMNGDAIYPTRECPDGNGGLVPDPGQSNPDPKACIDVPGYPVSVAVNPTNNRAYALTSTGEIVVIQGPNMTWQTIPLIQGSTAAGPRAIAVNPVTNRIYALYANAVAIVDGNTNAVSQIYGNASADYVSLAVDVRHDAVFAVGRAGSLFWFTGDGHNGTVGIPVDARGIVLDPISGTPYVLAANGVTTVSASGFPVAVGPPINVVIRPLAGNTSGASATLTFDASSGMSPSPLDQVRAVYYAVNRTINFDTTQNPLQPATRNADGSWSATVSGLQAGTSYTVYAFATNGLEMDSANTDLVHVPITSPIASYTWSTPPPDPGVVAKLIRTVTHADFNNDGRDDLAWHNNNGNQNALWLMNGAQIMGGVVLPNAIYSDSYILRPADFNGDGKTDLLWSSPAKGEGYIDSLMDGYTETSTGYLAAHLSRDLRAVGDFNGDGKADLLMNGFSQGGFYVELVDGTTGSSGTTAIHGNNGNPALVADLDGDGKDDIVWVDTDGTVTVCLMNGFECASNTVIRPAGNKFVPIAAGDFNGDGKTDIVWEAPDGTQSLWLMNGAQTINSASILGPGTGWHVIAAPDLNGDGKADLLFEHDDGSSAAWLMNGTSPFAYKTLLGPGTGWHVKQVADLNGDNKDDLIWRQDDGSYGVWIMNGLNAAGYGSYIGPGTGWEIVP